MNLTDKISGKITGIFELKVFRDGLLESHEVLQNLVVTTGKTAATKLLGGDGTGKNITNIGFGTSGSVANLADTALADEYSKAVDAISYPSAQSVKFDFALELAENNGVTIEEFGLICSDASLFARRTRAPIIKDSSVRLEGSWTINI